MNEYQNERNDTRIVALSNIFYFYLNKILCWEDFKRCKRNKLQDMVKKNGKQNVSFKKTFQTRFIQQKKTFKRFLKRVSVKLVTHLYRFDKFSKTLTLSLFNVVGVQNTIIFQRK